MRERRGRAVASAVFWVVVLVALTACSDGGGGDDAGDDGVPPPTGLGDESGCLTDGSTVAREGTEAPDAVLLTDVDVSEEGFCDRVRFEFESLGPADLPPYYTAEYQTGPFVDPETEDEVEVGGDAYLVITFTQTLSVDIRDPQGPPTYLGDEVIQPSGLNALQEARLRSEVAGTRQWISGLSSERPFDVDGASRPSRVIVIIG